jgi:hypothetical protein
VSCLVFRLKGQGPVMAFLVDRSSWLRGLECVATACEGLLIKPLAAHRPAWSSRRWALMAGADGQARHQCLADDASDEAEAAAQTGQYPRWRRRVIGGGCQVG